MNEFKVGDLVVYSELPYERLFTVVRVNDNELVVHEVLDEVGAMAFTEFYPFSDIRHAAFSDIRHATTKEISQGYRDE